MSAINLTTINGPAVRPQSLAFPYGRFQTTANPAQSISVNTATVLSATGSWSSDSDAAITAGYNAPKGGLVVPYNGVWTMNFEVRWNNVTSSTGTESWISISGTGVVNQFEVGHVQGLSMNSTSSSFTGYLQAGAIIAPTVYCTGSALTLSYATLNIQCQKNQ